MNEFEIYHRGTRDTMCRCFSDTMSCSQLAAYGCFFCGDYLGQQIPVCYDAEISYRSWHLSCEIEHGGLDREELRAITLARGKLFSHASELPLTRPAEDADYSALTAPSEQVHG